MFCSQVGNWSLGMPTEKEAGNPSSEPQLIITHPPTSIPTDSVVTFPENGEFQKLTATPTKTPKRYVEQGLAYIHYWVEQSQFQGLSYQLGPYKSLSRQASCISECTGYLVAWGCSKDVGAQLPNRKRQCKLALSFCFLINYRSWCVLGAGVTPACYSLLAPSVYP